VDTVRQPLLVLDAGLRVRVANRAFCALCGVERAAGEGLHLHELAGGRWRVPGLAALLRGVLDGAGAAAECEAWHDVDGTGARLLLLEARRVEQEPGEPPLVLLAVEDASERRRGEEEREALLAELRRSNEALERFAYVASHDLQEPLRMVTSFTQLLQQRYAGQLDEKADRYIGHAVDGAVRMRGLINDLLAYSRAGTRAAEPGPTDAGQALERAREMLAAAISASGAEVASDPLPTVRANASQLLQLFQNLLGNAVKFRGGRAPRVHVSARREGAWWIFAVRDNGIGVAPEYFERVFVLFQRLHTRGEYPGSGMGLAICKRIVERHGGRIWLESEPGSGATFFFTLPAAGDPP